jgi:hypothetical protein
MKYFALALCFMLSGCDGDAQSQPDGTTKQLDPTKAKYGREQFTLICVNHVEYMRFGNSSPVPKYNLDGTLVPCTE